MLTHKGEQIRPFEFGRTPDRKLLQAELQITFKGSKFSPRKSAPAASIERDGASQEVHMP